MRRQLLPLLLLLFSNSLTQASLVIDSIERKIDLSGHAERVRSVITVSNDGKKAESTMVLAVPSERSENLSFVKAIASKKKCKLINLPTTGPNDESLFEITFDKPLKPKQVKKITVISGFVGILTPYPAEGKQMDPHLVKYTGSLYEISPYAVKSQKTSIKLSTSNVLSSTKTKPYSSKGSKLSYGPYESIKPYAYKPLSIHFESKAQFSTLTELEREIKVCHWGGVVFSETYNLRHSGAKLKDVFSRIDYEKGQRGSSFDHFTAKLPENSYGIDYRDDIGNISTSNVRETSKNVVFEMRPRFPLFGGWKSIFNLYYTVPITQLVSTIPGTSSYMLNTTFSTPFDEVVTEKATIKVVLPEGSSDIQWVTPFHIDSVDFEVQKTYLDLTGRPVLVLNTRNLMRYHNQYFQVIYSYPNIMIHRGPLFVVIGFMLFFSISIFFSRVDLTIGREDQAGSEAAASSSGTNTKPKTE